MCTTVAAIALAEEYAQNGVSVCHRDFVGVGRVGGCVTPAVPDRAIEDDPPVMPQAQLDRRVETGLIPVPRGIARCVRPPRRRSPEWSSSPTAVTASRSAGTRILPSR